MIGSRPTFGRWRQRRAEAGSAYAAAHLLKRSSTQLEAALRCRKRPGSLRAACMASCFAGEDWGRPLPSGPPRSTLHSSHTLYSVSHCIAAHQRLQQQVRHSPSGAQFRASRPADQRRRKQRKSTARPAAAAAAAMSDAPPAAKAGSKGKKAGKKPAAAAEPEGPRPPFKPAKMTHYDRQVGAALACRAFCCCLLPWTWRRHFTAGASICLRIPCMAQHAGLAARRAGTAC